jgi:hypothetical protein
VSQIINEWDPIDLLSHAPTDEYEIEIKLIIDSLEKSRTTDELANNIYEIFSKRFGTDVFTKQYQECIEVAKKLLQI